ncbi:MAG TPA: Tn3 family transposase [Acidobacteriaceae bacterium]
MEKDAGRFLHCASSVAAELDAVLDQLRAEGYSVRPEDEARLSPFAHGHINMLERYSFAVPEASPAASCDPCETQLNRKNCSIVTIAPSPDLP